MFNETRNPIRPLSAYAACSGCLCAIANDDVHERDEAMRGMMDSIMRDYDLHGVTDLQFVADATELGFMWELCELCGDLPGERYKVSLIGH